MDNNLTYEQKVANINSVASTSAKDKALAISYLNKEPISPTTIEQPRNVVVPQTPFDTTPTISVPELTPIQAEEKRIQDEAMKSRDEYKNILQSIAGEQAKEFDYFKEEGGDVAQQTRDKAIQDLRQEQVNLRRRTEELRKTFGGTESALQGRIEQMNRESYMAQADLSITADIASGLYERARATAQAKVDQAVKPLQAQADYTKYILDNNQELLNTSQKAKLQSLYADQERKVAEEKERLTQGNEMILNAIQSSAPQATIAKAKEILEKGGTATEVASVLGVHSGDYYKIELLKEQIKTEKAQRASIVAKTEADKVSTKPATQAQYTAAGFASRVVQAKDIIDNNQEALMQLTAVQQTLQRKLPNMLKTPLMQSQEQAERNFVNAVLRRESGAAIADSEFDSASKQYFPRPGDSAEVLAQKKLNRDLTSVNLINEGGSAFQAQATQTMNPFNQALGKTGEIIPGTSIISSMSNGIINFNIPK